MSTPPGPERTLFVEPPAGRGRALPLPASGALVIGSSAESAVLVLPGSDVRPAHAAIARLKDGGFGIVAVDGAPLLVNSKAAASARLAEGDRIDIGPHTLRIVARRAGAVGAQLRVPERVAGFRVVRKLGSGAMGQVFLAVQESLAREVALKVLRAELAADAAFVKRFEAEARAAAALGHANVVTVYDVGFVAGSSQSAPPLHYLAMEFMARGSLEERLQREGPLPPREVLGALRDAARGLEYAELRGIVHRDIKPANLMQDGTGVVKIADLGLATQAEAEAEARVFGTAHFASPEQVRGERVDARADLYSLGASAYRLLTGRTPFQGADRREILRRVLEEPPTPLQPLVPTAHPELVALIERLLAKDPAARAPSAAALAREIDALALRLEHGALTPVRGRRLGLLLAGGFAVLAAGAAAYGFLGRTPQGADEPGGPRSGAESRAGNVGGATHAEAAFDTDLEDALRMPPTGNAEDPLAPGEVGAEDIALRAAEDNAAAALARASGLLDPNDRRDALEQLVTGFAGTGAAHEAQAILERERESGAVSATSAEAALNAARDPVLNAIGRVLALQAGGAPLAPDAAESALAAIPVPPVLVADATFEGRLGAEVDRYVAAAREHVRERLEEVERALLGGNFEGYSVALGDFLIWSEPAPATLSDARTPTQPLGSVPPAGANNALERARALAGPLATALDLTVLRARAQAAAAQQAELAAEFERAMAERDRARIGAEMGGAGGLAEGLIGFELAALATRIERLVPAMRSRGEAQALTDLAAHLLEARAAFDALVASHGRGEWRRQNVPVPGRRLPMATLARFETEGMRVAAGGEEIQVAYRDFGARTSELAQLFAQRLNREWSPDESRKIARAMAIAAAGELLVHALAILDPAVDARLSPSEEEALSESWDRVREWSARAGDTEWFERERRAELLIGRSLRALDGGDPLEVAWGLEQALADAPHSLAVRALFDGRPEGLLRPWPPEGWLALARPIEDAERAALDFGGAGDGSERSAD